MAKNSDVTQKIYLTRDELVTKGKGLFAKEQREEVFRVTKSENFPAKKYYTYGELDYLLDMGVKYVID